MEDRQLVNLIKNGASSWRGPSGNAGAARYAAAQSAPPRRLTPVVSGAIGIALLIGLALVAGPSPEIRSILVTIQKAGASEPAPATEPTPAGTQNATVPKSEPSQHSEPTPAKTDAVPPASHEPTPTPEPKRPPTSEPTPPTASK